MFDIYITTGKCIPVVKMCMTSHVTIIMMTFHDFKMSNEGHEMFIDNIWKTAQKLKTFKGLSGSEEA